MFEGLSSIYLKFIVNFRIILGDFTDCHAVERLRLFAVILGGVLFVRAALHIIAYARLRKHFPKYSLSIQPKLFRLLEEVAGELGLRRLPVLHRFHDVRPLVFTIGTLRPSIFIAPKLLNSLSSDELKAVLAHELSHIKRRDTAFIWLLELVAVSIPLTVIQLFAFNFIYSGFASDLAIWAGVLLILAYRMGFWRKLLFMRELSCDDKAIEAKTHPLVLASALVGVFRLGRTLPRYRWHYGLAFIHRLLPTTASVEVRTKRLLNYHFPKLRMFMTRVVLVLCSTMLIASLLFIWHFHRMNGNFSVDIVHSDDCKQHFITVLKEPQ